MRHHPFCHARRVDAKLRLLNAERYAKTLREVSERVRTMRLRKIVTGLLVASTLTLSVPVVAAPTPDYAGLQGDGGGFAGGGDATIGIILALIAASLATLAIVDSSKSP
jgi:hypothetical protein